MLLLQVKINGSPKEMNELTQTPMFFLPYLYFVRVVFRFFFFLNHSGRRFTIFYTEIASLITVDWIDYRSFLVFLLVFTKPSIIGLCWNIIPSFFPPRVCVVVWLWSVFRCSFYSSSNRLLFQYYDNNNSVRQARCVFCVWTVKGKTYRTRRKELLLLF